MEIENIALMILVIGLVTMFITIHLSVHQVILELEKEQFLKEQSAKESCSIQSFYELNFNLCYKTGVRP